MNMINKVLLVLFVLLLAFTQGASALNVMDTAISDSWDSTSHSFRISYVSSESGWDVAEETALTNTVHPLVTFTHTTSGTPANGIGLSLDWYQETAAANTELGARIEVVATDVTAASEDFRFDWMLMTAGATPATKMSLGSTGILTLVNGETIDNATTNGIIAFGTAGIDVQGGDIILENDEVIDNGTDGTVQIQSDTALTNSISPEFSLLHTTSGSPANGIGTGISFVQETSAGNNEIGMSLDAIATDVTGASEDFKFSVKLMTAGGAKSEKFSVASTGVMTLVNAATIDNSVDGTLTITEPIIAIAGGLNVDTDVLSVDATNDIVEINGFQDSPYLEVTAASYTLAAASKANYVVVNYTDTGAVGITLASAWFVDGRWVTIKDGELNAGTNNITIGTEGSETIDEAATYVMNANGEAVTILCDGTNAFIMSAYGE